MVSELVFQKSHSSEMITKDKKIHQKNEELNHLNIIFSLCKFILTICTLVFTFILTICTHWQNFFWCLTHPDALQWYQHYVKLLLNKLSIIHEDYSFSMQIFQFFSNNCSFAKSVLVVLFTLTICTS